MRWIVLALSLGAAIVSLIHGVMSVLTGGGPPDFTLMTSVLLLLSVFIALTGAILAFNRRKAGGIFIIVAALICLLAHGSTRHYGIVYIIAGALAFAIRGSSEYEYEYDDEYDERDEYGDDDEEDDDEERIVSSRQRGGRREERASAIKADREELSLNDDGFHRVGESRRSSKVCPACGASTGIDHKFCYTCGGPLHAMRMSNAEPNGLGADTPLTRKISSAFKDFKMVSTVDEPEEEDDDLQDEEPEKPVSHKVFIKSSDESEDEFDALLIEPDDSYQEFSRYTNRRKKKRISTVRRILAPLILLLAIGGAAWLLIGMGTRVPPPVQPPPPINGGEPVDPLPPPPPSPLVLLQIQPPTRGIVTGSNVNIRPTNAATGTVVTRLTAGARADIIDQRPGPAQHPGMWLNIRFNGRTGWIYGQFFQALDGRQATLPNGYTDALLNYFGLDRDELIDMLGQPTQQSPTAMSWPGLTAELSGDDVIRLQITGSMHVLANGVAVGTSEATLYSRIGHPSDSSAGQLFYIEDAPGARRGIAIRLHNGNVQSITVGNI